MSSSLCKCNLPRGFTLLELLVVMSLLVLILAVVVPNMRASDAAMFNAELRSAASLLNHARRRAIVEAEPVSAVLDSGQGGQTAALGDGEQEQHAGALRWHSESISLGYQGGPDAAIEAQEHMEVRFFPQGGSTGGTLFFYQEQLSGRIRVDPVSGRIEVAFNGKDFDVRQ